jgi:hypothetical protein
MPDALEDEDGGEYQPDDDERRRDDEDRSHGVAAYVRSYS